MSYLDNLQIPLNVNALGDHHAVGIIDNFAKRIKEILTKMFLKNDSTRWIDYIRGIISHYNKSPTSALNGLSPEEATTQAKKPEVLDMNIKKSIHNRMSNDLNPNDKVRKHVLFNDKNAKRTDPKWSEKVYTVVSTHGRTVILNDKT